jgi:sec-independent protein translocase protein TatB
MFNVGGGEILVILLVALLVLGPNKLPEAARQIGSVLTQVRRMSSGFQNEMRAALEETTTPSSPTAKPDPVDAPDATEVADAPDSGADDVDTST